jgi:hypothetical protein
MIEKSEWILLLISISSSFTKSWWHTMHNMVVAGDDYDRCCLMFMPHPSHLFQTYLQTKKVTAMIPWSYDDKRYDIMTVVIASFIASKLQSLRVMIRMVDMMCMMWVIIDQAMYADDDWQPSHQSSCVVSQWGPLLYMLFPIKYWILNSVHTVLWCTLNERHASLWWVCNWTAPNESFRSKYWNHTKRQLVLCT